MTDDMPNRAEKRLAAEERRLHWKRQWLAMSRERVAKGGTIADSIAEIETISIQHMKLIYPSDATEIDRAFMEFKALMALSCNAIKLE